MNLLFSVAIAMGVTYLYFYRLFLFDVYVIFSLLIVGGRSASRR